MKLSASLHRSTKGRPSKSDDNNRYMRNHAPALLILVSVLITTSCAGLIFSTEPKDRHKILAENRCEAIFNRLTNFVRDFPPTTATLTQDHRMYLEGYIGVRGYDILGDLYYNGCENAGLRPQKLQAAKWYEYGAIGHVPESQFKFGRMLYEGDGISRDEVLGIQWLTSAATEGNVDARQLLQDLGVQAPEPLSPNTYLTIQAKQKVFRKESNQQWFSEAFQDVLGLAVIAAVAYSSADYAHGASAPGSAVSSPRPQIQRFRPVYCTTTTNLTVTGSSYAVYANGFSSTFCS